MTENKSISNTKSILEFTIKGMQEKKGKHIVDMDLSNIENAVSNHFVVCHGDSGRQVSAIADAVQEFVKKSTNENP